MEEFAAMRPARYPDRIPFEADLLRKLVAEIIAMPHLYVDGDSWFSCSQAVAEPWPGRGEEPGSGCSDERRAGKPCDCGRDAKVRRMLGLIAAHWAGDVGYQEAWRP